VVAQIVVNPSSAVPNLGATERVAQSLLSWAHSSDLPS
jgi:hypothetical protein